MRGILAALSGLMLGALLFACGKTGSQPPARPSIQEAADGVVSLEGASGENIAGKAPGGIPPEGSPSSEDSRAEPSSISARPSAMGPPGMAGPTLVPSKHGERLRELGLDPLALPLMRDLTPSQRYGVMDLLSESLGVPCGQCHKGKNYKTETHSKIVARFMWDEMTVLHRLEEGPLFCDSCHQGTRTNLDRSHPEGVKPYMTAEYSGRLLRTSDGSPVECATCHGESFEPDILDRLQ